jgi:hypothetical protein
MATLPGAPYSRSNPGCVYLVPVHAIIDTQEHYFEVHVSHYLVVKQLIAGGNYVKGTHLNPELRKKQNPALRKKQDLSKRKPSKKQDLALRKKQDLALRKKADRTGWNGNNSRQTDADILLDIQLRFETHGGEGFASPQKVILRCGNTTNFFIKNAKLGLRAVSMAKKKRWRELPCFNF